VTAPGTPPLDLHGTGYCASLIFGAPLVRLPTFMTRLCSLRGSVRRNCDFGGSAKGAAGGDRETG